MKATINDVAKMAGVSIATVSHVINKTRYVSPELSQKVYDAMEKTGYINKITEKERKADVGQKSVIALVVPSLVPTMIYNRAADGFRKHYEKQGKVLAVYITNFDYKYEQSVLQGLIMSKRTAGIIIAPVNSDSSQYTSLLRSGIPYVFISRYMLGERVPLVKFNTEQAIELGTDYLISRGHTSIGILLGNMDNLRGRACMSGYVSALKKKGLEYNEKMVFSVENEFDASLFAADFYKYYKTFKPSAIVAPNFYLTLMLMHTVKNIGLKCPRDISIVGFGYYDWSDLMDPPITIIRQDADEMCEITCRMLDDQLIGRPIDAQIVNIPLKLCMNKSTRQIVRGPFGEKTSLPDEIVITQNEKKILRESNFKAAISFNAFKSLRMNLQKQGIRHIFDDYGISVLALTDADNDEDLQVTQLDSIMLQNPDAIIVVPIDSPKVTAKLKEIGKKTKLVLLENVPNGMQISDYCSCVSVNENELGELAVSLMGKYYEKTTNVKAGFIIHGTRLYGTHVRDESAEQMVKSSYPNIKIVAKMPYHTEDNAFKTAIDMVTRHPEINTLYVTGQRAALEVIKALKQMRREDITLFTCDLDKEIAKYLASDEFVKGISAQKPFDQGVAAANAVSKALLNDFGIKYTAVPPCSVTKNSLLATWKDIMHENPPAVIESALEESVNRA